MSEGSCKKNQETFLALVRAGQWEEINDNENQNENLFEGLDWGEVQKLAEGQSVVGLVAAGVERLTAYSLPLTEKLTLLGKCQLIEQRNKALNSFIGELLRKLQEANIKSLLVKGQGVAQCYSKPNWRVSGDVDLLLDGDNYEEAKALLLPLAYSQKPEERYSRHLGLTIGSWYVELHGSLRTGLSSRIDKEVDLVQKDTFVNGRFRSWRNGETNVLLPAPDNDVFFVFMSSK